ncbi:hypothetical protein QBC37DRAFT_449004 [Rhypophila decipiens]|uniref:Uncharacterized protein n=1 Tax=Rhypophila decipiens TaxID=261697 RepID=A0AAN7B419_9PEZI|nr:hypothetical protein QBC37DRAFT_449004 [Rhypophila decipiens]
MHFSKTTKAIFILANYVTASLIPPHLKINVRLNPSPNGHGTADNVDLVENNQALNESVVKVPEALLPRQQSCDRCRTRCPPGKIINPAKCRRCIRCPPGMKADPTSRICIKGDPEPDEEEKAKKKADKEKRYQDKKEDEKQKHKIKKYDSKKGKEKVKYQANEEHKKNNERRKRVRRAGRCLPLVAMAMGAGVAAEFADELFDEAYLESMDLEQFWPDDVAIEPFDSEESDKIFEDDKYIDEWIKVGENNTHYKVVAPDIVSIAGKRDETRTGGDDLVDMAEVPVGIAARQGGGLIRIIGAILGTASRAGAAAGRAGGEILKLSKYAIKIGKGRSSKKSFKEQSEAAKKIAANKNWKKCLSKGSPAAGA